MTDENNNGANGANGADWKALPFDRLRGNFKGNYDYKLTSKVIIVGPNQSGKSGPQIGGRYALAGVKGWTLGVHGSDIADLAPEGVDTLFHEFSGPSGKAFFKVLKEEGKWREPDKDPEFSGELKLHLRPEHKEKILPLLSMSDLFKLGPDLGRRALMKRFGDATRVPSPIKPKPEQAALWAEVKKTATELMTKKDEVSGEKFVPDASQILVAMNKAFAKIKRDEGKKISALQEALDQRKAALVEEAAGAEIIPKLRENLELAKRWEAAAHFRARKAEIEADKVKFRESRVPFDAADSAESKARRKAEEDSKRYVFNGAIETAQKKTENIEADIRDQADKLSWGQNLVAALRRADKNCVLCKTEMIIRQDHPAEPFDREKILALVEPAVKSREESIKNARTFLAAAHAELNKARGDLAAYERQLTDARRIDEQARQRMFQEHSRISSADREIEAALAQSNAPASYTGLTAAELTKQIGDLEMADIARKKLEADTEEIRRLTDTRTLAKGLEDESKTLLDSLIARVKDTAETTINKYMAEGLRMTVDLEQNCWRVVDTKGIGRDKHTASGFEEDSATPALAAGYTEGSPLRMLLLDDPDIKGVGLENVPRFFGALSRAVDNGWLTQVIVAGNRLEPMLAYLESAGWTIIRTGELMDVQAVFPTYVIPSGRISTTPTPAVEFSPPAQPDERSTVGEATNVVSLFDSQGIPRL